MCGMAESNDVIMMQLLCVGKIRLSDVSPVVHHVNFSYIVSFFHFTFDGGKIVSFSFSWPDSNHDFRLKSLQSSNAKLLFNEHAKSSPRDTSESFTALPV